MATKPTVLASTTPAPGLPVPISTPFDNVYILSYIHKIKMNEKAFYAIGTMQEIVTRAKSHCEQCGYRFLFVRPFLSDFLEDEKKHRASY